MASAPELTTKEINRVSKCLGGTRNEHRDRCYFFMLLFTGMRVGEALQLKNGDVVNADGSIKESTIITKTKNGKSRRIYFPQKFHKYASAHYNEKHDDDMLMDCFFFQSKRSAHMPMSLVNATRLIKNCFINSGMPDKSSHSLRRTCAIFLRRDVGCDLEVIRTILGHQSIRQSQTYFSASTIEASDALNGLNF